MSATNIELFAFWLLILLKYYNFSVIFLQILQKSHQIQQHLCFFFPGGCFW